MNVFILPSVMRSERKIRPRTVSGDRAGGAHDVANRLSPDNEIVGVVIARGVPCDEIAAVNGADSPIVHGHIVAFDVIVDPGDQDTSAAAGVSVVRAIVVNDLALV